MRRIDDLNEVLRVNDLVVVEFTGPNCAACKKMKAMLEKIEGEYPEFVFCEVDVEESPSLASQFYVMSVPMTFILADGIVVDQIEGAVSLSKIQEKLSAVRGMA